MSTPLEKIRLKYEESSKEYQQINATHDNAMRQINSIKTQLNQAAIKADGLRIAVKALEEAELETLPTPEGEES